jgi:hypothetical protein
LKGNKLYNPFVTFMSSTTGRIVRIVGGLLVIALGLFVVQSTGGIIIAVLGAVPLLAGIFDFCVFAPVFGTPWSGKKIRANSKLA